MLGLAGASVVPLVQAAASTQQLYAQYFLVCQSMSCVQTCQSPVLTLVVMQLPVKMRLQEAHQ